MRGIFTKQYINIDAGDAVSGIANRARTLRILHGRVWLTVEGISHDYWLSEGDSFPVPPGLRIVLEADGSDSRIDVAGGSRSSILAGIRKPVRELMQRLAGRNTEIGLRQCSLQK